MAWRMSKIVTWCIGLALAGALAGCGQPAVVRAAGSWGQAIEVPGLGALNKSGDAQVTSVSCASAGNCAAGGYYADRNGQQGFVAAERNGRWRQAIEVPGLGALNTEGTAQVSSVSCASAGNCAAGGYYADRNGQQGFAAAERNGVWGNAIEVPGLAALNKGQQWGAEVSSVSCTSPGNCTAGGHYADRNDDLQGFVVSEKNGVWDTAIEVPGLGTLNTGGGGGVGAQVSYVSCGAAGSCAAVGSYAGSQGVDQGFIATERRGRWGTAIKVPGLKALGKVDASDVNSVSCTSAGNCAAGGTYHVSGGGWQGFVGTERHGVWGTAIKLPGLAALNKGGFAKVNSVSCASAGNCAAGGLYSWRGGFVVVEQNGRWGTAIKVPGLDVPNAGQVAEVVSVSCVPAGNCAAGGYYFDRSDHFQVFVASEDNGVWGTAIQVPGLAALNKGSGQFARVTYYPTVSCAPFGTCAVGGSYIDASGHAQGFVTQAR
jgi:hypothetical protein